MIMTNVIAVLRKLLAGRSRKRDPVKQRQDSVVLWGLHQDAQYFMSRGGDCLPPPRACNIALTNKCNLRCEICGSQKLLDSTNTPRRHMDREVMEMVAETIFPFMVHVELNSQGDPLLYPHIERVLELLAKYECKYSIQTNGTLLTDNIIDGLLDNQGVLKLSIDAVGSKFDEVRRGGVWAKAEPQLLKFLTRRDPHRNPVWLYPTITARTLPEMMNLIEWSHRVKVDHVIFHPYDPVEGSIEECVSLEAIDQQLEHIAIWLKSQGSKLHVRLAGRVVYAGKPAGERFNARIKEPFYVSTMQYPLVAGHESSDPEYLCPVPSQYIEIGLDGQINVCCRSQDIPMGFATSNEKFADAWFGKNYELLRHSLLRGAKEGFSLPQCEACIREYAPDELGIRKAVDYTGVLDSHMFSCADSEIQLVSLSRERGFCCTARLPLGLDVSLYALWEDGKRMAEPGSLHDQIRQQGNGRNNIGSGVIYFSSTDNSDPILNGRRYVLRRRSTFNNLLVAAAIQEAGHCYTCPLPINGNDVQYSLYEDGHSLGPSGAMHDDIRQVGRGRYCISNGTLYFSSSDNSNPSTNGRAYSLQKSAVKD